MPSSSELVAVSLADLEAILARADRRFLAIDDAATFAGISVKSIRRLIKRGTLTPLRPVRGKIVIDRFELEHFVLSSSKPIRKGRGISTKGERQ